MNVEEKGTISMNTIPLIPLRDMIWLEGGFSEVMDASFYENVDTEAYIRMTLTDDMEVLDAFSRLRVVYPNLMLMDYKKRSRNMEHGMGEAETAASLLPSELFEQFYQEMNHQPINEAQRDYLQEKIQKIWGV